MQRVKPGQKVRAAELNSIFEALDLQPSSLQGGGLSRGLPGLVALAENISGAALPPFAAVVIAGQSLTINPQGQREIVLQIDQPAAGDDMSKLAVVQDAIPAGMTGRVCVSGVCWVETDETEGAYASPAEDQLTVTLGDSGPAEVLSGSGEQYALIRFPVGTTGEFVEATELNTVGWLVENDES